LKLELLNIKYLNNINQRQKIRAKLIEETSFNLSRSDLKHIKFYEGFDFTSAIINNRVYRFPKNKDSVKKMQSEYEVLKFLKNKINLPVPSFIKTKTKNNFVFYKEILGSDFTPNYYKKLTERQKNILCRDLVGFLNQVHGLSLPKKIKKDLPKENWIKIYLQIKKDILKYLGRSEEYKIFLDLFKNLAYKKKTACLVHGDLSGDNIIIDKNNNKVSGIIDFGDVRLSDSIVDFAPFWNFGREVVHKLAAMYTNDKAAQSQILLESNLYYCYTMINMAIITLRKNK